MSGSSVDSIHYFSSISYTGSESEPESGSGGRSSESCSIVSTESTESTGSTESSESSKTAESNTQSKLSMETEDLEYIISGKYLILKDNIRKHFVPGQTYILRPRSNLGSFVSKVKAMLATILEVPKSLERDDKLLVAIGVAKNDPEMHIVRYNDFDILKSSEYSRYIQETTITKHRCFEIDTNAFTWEYVANRPIEDVEKVLAEGRAFAPQQYDLCYLRDKSNGEGATVTVLSPWHVSLNNNAVLVSTDTILPIEVVLTPEVLLSMRSAPPDLDNVKYCDWNRYQAHYFGKRNKEVMNIFLQLHHEFISRLNKYLVGTEPADAYDSQELRPSLQTDGEKSWVRFNRDLKRFQIFRPRSLNEEFINCTLSVDNAVYQKKKMMIMTGSEYTTKGSNYT